MFSLRVFPTTAQVGFHDDKLVKRTQVQRRLNEIVNRLNKTQVGGSTRMCVALQAKRL